MIFSSTYNNKVYPLHEVKSGEMGFSIKDPSYIPNEYLAQENFTILRKFKNWYKIRLHTDKYVGFILKKNFLSKNLI